MLARYQGESLTGWVSQKIEGWMGLELSLEKTETIDLREKGKSVDFLGYTFRFDKSLYGDDKKPYLNVFPSKKSVAREREKLRELTARRRGCVPIPRMVSDINRHLRGWGNYYGHGYPRKVFRQINAFVEQRLWTHLRRRSQRPFRCPEGKSFHAHLGKLGLARL